MELSTNKPPKSGSISIGLCGAAGRMGREIFRASALSADMKIVRAYEMPGHRSIGMKIGDAAIESDDTKGFLEGCQVLVDFSAPPVAVISHLEKAAKAKVAAVVGSTGLDQDTRQKLEKIARQIPVLYSANMSLGVNLLIALAQRTQELLGGGFDIDVVEMHHRGKKDAPSGTSLMIEHQLRMVDPDLVVNHHSLRAGDVIGEHTVLFTGIGERLELTHRVSSREAFSKGVLAAVRFISKQTPGFYDMRKVLGI
ncbi:MAG: 4-hydroxy-tetrahydrodipicolinate reductase [bacterium]|nr:4-hydroxy-tetrahydrodipicolinate reductase [bacterium]